MNAGAEMALRLVRADAELWSAWVDSLAALPENPYEATLRRFEGTVALFVHRVPVAYYNRVIIDDNADAAILANIASFYRERMMPCRFDMSPYAADPEVLETLDMFGFRPAGFQSNLFGPVEYVNEKPIEKLTVSQVTAGQIEFFGRFFNNAYYEGQSVPRGLKKFREATVRARLGRPGWHLYLCCVDDVPASGAMLYANDGIATLTGAATASNFRGHGCQRALLRARINDAARLKCKLVVARCGVGTASQRNLERAGLQTGYTKIIWEHRDMLASKPQVRPRRQNWLEMMLLDETSDRRVHAAVG